MPRILSPSLFLSSCLSLLYGKWAKDLCQYKHYNRVCQPSRRSSASHDTYVVACVCKTHGEHAYVMQRVHTYDGDSRRSRFSTTMNDEFAQSPESTRLTLPVNIPRYTGCPATRYHNFNDGFPGVILRTDFAFSKHVRPN